MSILRNKEDVDTLHRDGHLLGRYRSAPDTPDGVLAEVAIEAQPAPC